MNYIYILLCLSLALMSCDRQKKQGNIVHWHDGVALYSVVYSINGQELGRGKKAYESLIKQLSGLPGGSHITFRFPADIAGLILDRTQLEEPLPFDGHETERVNFNELMLKKGFTLTLDSYVPVEYVK
ncbi:MAG: hypothetical protein OJI67_09600 [Prosthecobacter sp.]|nr:hypothetical protein [Prosthecobacter sp.]